MLSALIGCTFALCAAVISGPPSHPLDASAVYAQQDVTKFPIIANGKIIAFSEMIAQMAHADVVFVGEEHNDKNAHALELAILQALHTNNPNLALSMEMFERDVQPVVDEYLGDYITETHFLQSSRPWPNYKTDYRPLVEFCRENHLPVIAANAPRRYVNIVSRKGPQALLELPKESKAYLPHLPYSLEIPEAYDRELTTLFGGQHDVPTAGQIAPAVAMPSVANLKAAQSLWDMSMQDSITRFLKHNRRQVLQINGSMHSDKGYGIVYHLRKAAPQLKVMVVTVKPDTDYMNPAVAKYANLADFVFVSPKEPAAAGNE
jgi:uncharacterized iron-regulated protein